MQPDFPRLNTELHDRLWAYVSKQFVYHVADWKQLVLNGEPLGQVNAQWQAQIEADWSGAYIADGQALYLTTPDWLTMADNLHDMAHGWHKLGVLSGWRNEAFAVHNQQGQFLFSLERAAFRPLGLCSHAVHINGLVKTASGWQFWIGKRSPFKAVDPDKLDNIVGGGIASGESVEEALKREAEEEAGLPAEWLEGLPCVGLRMSLRQVSRGLHREVLHIYDCVLPENSQPENQDGEVVSFQTVDATTLAEWMANGRLVNDALLVTLDAFWRYGLLKTDHPLAKWLENTYIEIK